MADAIPPVVETTEGGVRGTAQDGFLVFKGIPYAAPPVGPRRWLPPDPPAVRSAVLEAQAFGPACPQPPYPGVQATSEDCLTLNIWTPDVSGSHPVLFWMHGGAFVQNWGGNRLTDGAALARRGVVVVTINYRLGVLGIFAHPALSAERPAGPLANFALMDQLAALRWIKKNIPRFGGDPGNVTISGSSAGATSSLFLMTSGASGGLFHKVIAQSGGAREDVIDLAAEEKAGSAFGLTLGVPADASPAAAAALRALPVATITTANGLWEGPSLPPLATKPIVDDRAASTEDDANAIIRGTPNDAFVPGGSILAPAAFLIGSADGESCGRSCPQGALTSIAPRGAFAADLERAAAVAATGARTYVYYFRFVPGRSGESADHGASLPYTFGATISRDPEANRISSLMMDYWVSFMKTGFPAGASGPAWPAYDPREPKSMVFSNADEGGVAVLPIAGAGGSAPPAPASTDVLTVETTIPLPSAPHSLYYNPSENKVYSANPDANSVTVVDGATNQVLATLSLPKGPRAFGHDSHNGRVYTANYYANNLSVIDAKTDRIVATIPSGGAPRDLVYNPVERKIYCANESTDDVTVIDAERMAVIATVAVGKAPRVLSYNPTNSTVYTANSQSSNITVIDGRTDRAIATVSAGRVPKSIVHNPKNRKVYVSNYGGDSVTIIDAATQQVRRTISVGKGPSELFYDAEKNLVYCALIADPGPNRGSDSVVAIDGESDEIVKTIRAEDEPMAFASLSSPHLLFWLNEWSDSISVIDGAAGDVLQVVKVGRQPVDIAANPVRRWLYVGNGLGKSITVLRCISSRYCPQTAEPPVAPRLAGVVNAAGGRAGVIAPNAYYSLFGSNLGSAGGAVSVYDTTGRERLGATVFTSPGQVNFRTPPDQPLGASVIKFIREDGATALLNATTAAVDPGVFAVVFATGPNAGQRPANDRPARVGDILSIYGTGLGPAAGTAIVLFGGVRVVPSYAGDAPGLPGVNQVNFTVPAGAAQGSVPVSLTVGGMASNPVPVIVAGGGAAPYPSGLSEAVMTVDGVVRRYLVHVPAGLVGAPRALVFVLHGGGGEGVGVAQTGAHPLSVFREVADRERFVVVYPEGRTGGDGNPSWNDCRSDNRVGSSADDIAFLSALIDKVRNEYQLPRSRVFMAGGSNGGQMTQSFAAHRPEMVAAIATSSANLPQNPKPGRCTDGVRGPMPALITHGASDPAMPFAGGCVANLGGVCNRGVVISAEETVRRWLEQNGLAEAKPAQSVVDIDSRDAGPANRFYYPGPAPFEWWRLDGAGHTVPSIKVRVPPSAAAGRQNNDIEFAEAAWAFFGSLLPAQ